MKRIVIIIVTSLVLLVIGFAFSKSFIDFSISLLELQGASITMNSISSLFYEAIKFSLTLGLIPVLFTIASKVINKNQKSIFVLLPIVLSGLVSWLIRIYQLNLNFEYYSKKKNSQDVLYTYPYDSLNFSVYIFGGLVLGSFLSIVVFKFIKSSQENES